MLLAPKPRENKDEEDGASTPVGNEDTDSSSKVSSTISTTRLIARDGGQGNKITILSRPKPIPTIPSATANPKEYVNVDIEHSLQPLVLTGRKGNRVGRKERERAKARRDRERAALEAEAGQASGSAQDQAQDLDAWRTEDDNGVGVVGEDAPPTGLEPNPFLELGARSSRKDTKNRGASVAIALKDNVLLDTTDDGSDGEVGREQEDGQEELEEDPNATPTKGARSRKNQRTKRMKPLVQAASFPTIHPDATQSPARSKIRDSKTVLNVSFDEGEELEEPRRVLDQSKRCRLLALAKKLQRVFPEQKKDLGKVIQRLEGNGITSNGQTTGSLARSGSMKKKGGKGHVRSGSGKGSGSYVASAAYLHEEGGVEELKEQDPAELLIVGAEPGEGDPLIHVFIDQ